MIIETQITIAGIAAAFISQWAVMTYQQGIQDKDIRKLSDKQEAFDQKLQAHEKEDEAKHAEFSRRMSEQEISRAEIKAIMNSVVQRLDAIEKRIERLIELSIGLSREDRS